MQWGSNEKAQLGRILNSVFYSASVGRQDYDGWYAALSPGTTYTVGFSQYTDWGYVVVYNNGTEVTDNNQKKSLLESRMSSAISCWTSAADSRINMSVGTGGTHFTVNLQDMTDPTTETLGHSISYTITINTYWGLTANGTRGTRIDFFSAIIHELGHVFGADHIQIEGYENSVMWPAGDHNKTYTGLSGDDQATIRNLYDPYSALTFKISTPKGDVGGTMRLDGGSWQSIPSSGGPVYWRASTFPHTAEVQNGQIVQIGGQNYATNLLVWYQGATPDGASNPHTISVGNLTWKASMELQYNLTFSNNLPGVSSNGSLKIDDVTRSSGYVANVWSSSGSVKGEGLAQTIDGIQYTFSKWEDNSTTNPRTFTVTDHGSHTITYNPKPDAPTNLYSSGDPGDQVTLHWSDNPNQYVSQYEIRRSWNRNRAYEYAGTVNRGTQTWRDEACQITESLTDSLVHYQVIGKFSYNGINVNSDPAITSIYGKEGYEMKARNGVPNFVGSRPSPNRYSIGNYPNPFNPTTIIVYDLVEDARVRLDIFDVSGRLISTLVDGIKTSGDHATVWRATDKTGKSVAGGFYFYRIVARPLSGLEPFVKSGKLVLMK